MSALNRSVPIERYRSALEDCCKNESNSGEGHKGNTSVAKHPESLGREDTEIEDQECSFVQCDDYLVHDLGCIKPLIENNSQLPLTTA